MKSVYFLAVVFGLVCFAAAVSEKCDTNADCGEGECCVQLSRFLSAKCKPFRREHEICLPVEVVKDDSEKYSTMCPCGEGLTCKAKVTKEDGGVTTYRDATCKKSE